MSTASDLPLLARAVDLAREARERGDHPFGALLADGAGAVLAEARNSVVTGRDVTGHAELNLVRLAWAQLEPEVVAAATLYTSTEPCAMCAGAIYWAGIPRVVYALGADELNALLDMDDPDALHLPCREVLARGGRVTEVDGPFALPEARAVHAGFWR